ncbi:MAG: hypothetical protein KJ767_00575 [Nanoarchaeota archaeon]|nr:hypothetical protein [Nanoarchaeota archaeon]
MIIGGILIFIMMASTFGIIVNSFGGENDVGKVEYNGYEFKNENGFWKTTIGNYDFIFRYNPVQVERIEAELGYLSDYSEVPVYIFSEDYVSEVEIYRNLGDVVERFQGACLTEEGCKENWPIKDCLNNFIIIKEANESRIYQDENCVFIEGKKENLTQLTDEFLFWILGIER